MTPLRQRMIDAMVLRGFSPRTQQSYVDAIYGMAKHYRRDPSQYSAQEVEAYLLHLINARHLSYSTMNQAACAARFLYEKVLGRERELFPSNSVHLSTVANSKFGNTPWLNIESAGWLNIQSALTSQRAR